MISSPFCNSEKIIIIIINNNKLIEPRDRMMQDDAILQMAGVKARWWSGSGFGLGLGLRFGLRVSGFGLRTSNLTSHCLVRQEMSFHVTSLNPCL